MSSHGDNPPSVDSPSVLAQEAAIIEDIGVEDRLKQRMDDLSYDIQFDWLMDQYVHSTGTVSKSAGPYLSDAEIKAQGIQYAIAQARKLETEANRYPDDWDDRRQRVFKRDGYECTEADCSREGELHCHHRVPISQGGSHDLHNLTTLCKRCHKNKHPAANI